MKLATTMTAPLFFGLIVLACVDIANAQSGPGQSSRFRASVIVETNPVVNKRLRDVKEYLSKPQWKRAAPLAGAWSALLDDVTQRNRRLAIDLLERVSSQQGNTLFPVEPGRYVNAGHYCNLLLASLPDAALVAYRKRDDARIRKQFDLVLKARDLPAMKRIVRRAFVSSVGDDALFVLGRWAWQRGDLAKARRYWLQMISLNRPSTNNRPPPILRFPKTDFDVPTLRARCVLCDLLLGKRARAEREIRELRRRHPAATGTIAGQTGKLADLLTEILRQSRQWSRPFAAKHSATFAGNPARNRIEAKPVEVGIPLWSRRLDWRSLTRTDAGTGRKRQRHAACFPIVVNGNVFVCNADRVYAYDLKTGGPAFPLELNRKSSPENAALLYPEVSGMRPPLPKRPVLGVPFFSLTIHRDRLYARMGSPITGRVPEELQATRSRLICYQLAGPRSELKWVVSAKFLGNGWEFEGSPVVTDERIFVALRRRLSATQTFVACFNSDTGKLIWKQKVCAAIATPGREQNHVSHNLLTLSNETIFYATNLGAIAALNTDDGRLEWLTAYETSRPRSLADLNNPALQGFTPCLWHRGILVAAPVDSPFLMGIDAESGIVRWRRRIRGGVRQILAADGNRVIVSGNSLWAVNLQTGQIEWTVGFIDPASYGFGRGLLAGDVVYWPLRKEILIVRQKTGAIVRRIALRALHGGSGGNLLIADGKLIVAEPNRLIVYGNLSGLPKRKKLRLISAR